MENEHLGFQPYLNTTQRFVAYAKRWQYKAGKKRNYHNLLVNDIRIAHPDADIIEEYCWINDNAFYMVLKTDDYEARRAIECQTISFKAKVGVYRHAAEGGGFTEAYCLRKLTSLIVLDAEEKSVLPEHEHGQFVLMPRGWTIKKINPSTMVVTNNNSLVTISEDKAGGLAIQRIPNLHAEHFDPKN